MKQAAKALIRNDQGKILVLYRSETHPHLAHDIDLPGGEIELDETSEQGLIREIFEETGLNIKIVPGDKVYSWKSFSGSENYLYEVTIPADFNIKISWEHESYEWISDDELINKSAEDEFMYRVKQFLSKKHSGEPEKSEA